MNSQHHLQKEFNRIMVIDDAPIDRFIAQKVITKTGFSKEVVCMESAMDALNYLSEHENKPEELPDLIFLDINMPEMNGFDFLDAYKKFPEHLKRKCIIVMLSSSLHTEDHQRAKISPYVCQFLSKPLTPQKLESFNLTQ